MGGEWSGGLTADVLEGRLEEDYLLLLKCMKEGFTVWHDVEHNSMAIQTITVEMPYFSRNAIFVFKKV